MSKETKCFTCNRQYNQKNIWIDEDNNPICESCLWEALDHQFWDDEYIPHMLHTIKEKFNRNYKKWKKWFFKNHSPCKGEHPSYSEYYAHNDEICDDGFCSRCCDRFVEKLGYPKKNKCQKCKELRDKEESDE